MLLNRAGDFAMALGAMLVAHTWLPYGIPMVYLLYFYGIPSMVYLWYTLA